MGGGATHARIKNRSHSQLCLTIFIFTGPAGICSLAVLPFIVRTMSPTHNPSLSASGPHSSTTATNPGRDIENVQLQIRGTLQREHR